MTLYNHSQTCNSIPSYMESLSAQLQSPVIKNCIQVPASMGNGFVKHCGLEEGISLRYYHFNLNCDLEFNWFADSETTGSIFKLVVALEALPPGSEGQMQEKKMLQPKEEYSTRLYAADFNRTAMIRKNTSVNRMVLLITKKWLQDNFNEASEHIMNTVNLLIHTQKPALITQEMDRSHYIFAYELAKGLGRPDFPLIHIKTRALTLLNNFLDRFVAQDINKFHIVDQTLYYPEITRVEKLLRQAFNKPMPNISKLASEYNLSSSTLKRHFKIVYGETIQHYYLANKMAVGKSLIIARSKSISEIAHSLGYTKVNSFSKVFKKHYGLLPKEVNSHNHSL